MVPQLHFDGSFPDTKVINVYVDDKALWLRFAVAEASEMVALIRLLKCGIVWLEQAVGTHVLSRRV